jgi:hypothetical protein
MFRKVMMACGLLALLSLAAGTAADTAAGKSAGTVQGGHGSHDDGQSAKPVDAGAFQWQLAALREAIARFHDLDVAIQEGYAPFGPCFSDPTGAMGFHYANAELMEDPEIDPLHPELLMYEPLEDGSRRLVGVEYVTFQAAWHAAGHRRVPALFEQRFHLNTTLLSEPFYLLHVWTSKHNPSGIFADWNPRVTCR